MKLNLNSKNPIESILSNRINHILYLRGKNPNRLLKDDFVDVFIPELFISFDRKGGEGFFFYLIKENQEYSLSSFSDSFDFSEYIGEINHQGKENHFKMIPYKVGVYFGEDIKDYIDI